MKTALLLIDIQNDYFPGGNMELEGMKQASDNAATLLSEFRQRQLPVIHIQHIAVQPGATFFLPDTQGANIHPSVTPLGSETVIIKNYPNSFRNTGLLAHLKEQQISHLVIAGMMTHMCIDSSTRAACDLEFSIKLASDACATRALTFADVHISASDVQNTYLASLNGSFAEVLSTQEIIAGLASE
jgi:nicotinamidase-related amidase